MNTLENVSVGQKVALMFDETATDGKRYHADTLVTKTGRWGVDTLGFRLLEVAIRVDGLKHYTKIRAAAMVDPDIA